MKFFKRRKPIDLVESQLAELEARKIKEQPDLFVDSLIDSMNDEISAAGGWCAPSKTIYSLPEISVRRGGIRFPAPTDDAWIGAGQRKKKSLRSKITMTRIRG